MSAWRWFSVEPHDGRWAIVEIDARGKTIKIISRHRTKNQAWRRRDQIEHSQRQAQFHSVGWEMLR